MEIRLQLSTSQICQLFDGLSAIQLCGVLYAYSRENENLTDSDIELLNNTVSKIVQNIKNDIDTDLYFENLSYFYNVGILSDELGLQVLQMLPANRIKHINKYEPHYTHIDYINSLCNDEKNELIDTFWNIYIKEIEFIYDSEYYTKPCYELCDVKCNIYKICELSYFYNEDYILVDGLENVERILEIINKHDYQMWYTIQKLNFEWSRKNSKSTFDVKHFDIPNVKFVKRIKQADENCFCSYTVVDDIKIDGLYTDIEAHESCQFYHDNMLCDLKSTIIDYKTYYIKSCVDAWIEEQKPAIEGTIKLLEIEASYSKYTCKVEHDYGIGFTIRLYDGNILRGVVEACQPQRHYVYGDYETISQKLGEFMKLY